MQCMEGMGKHIWFIDWALENVIDLDCSKWGVTSNLHSLARLPQSWEQNKRVVPFILTVLVCKQQKYSADDELHFILNIEQAVAFPVSKQLEQPGAGPEAAGIWDVSPTDISEAFFFSAILVSVLCKANCMCRVCTYIRRYQIK